MRSTQAPPALGCALRRRPPRPRRRAAAAAPSAALGSGPALGGLSLVGVGSATPRLVVTNGDLSRLVDTNDEWIASRTGIRERRVLSGGESMTGLASQAASAALRHARLDPASVDLVLLCTSSPDDAFGGACAVAAACGCTGALALDLTAACSGFVLGLVTAAQFLRAGGAATVLLVGADGLSRYVDWTDRGTCILFGDAAGAVVLAATPGPCGLLGWDARSDGHGADKLHARFCPPAGAKPSLATPAAAAAAAAAQAAAAQAAAAAPAEGGDGAAVVAAAPPAAAAAAAEAGGPGGAPGFANIGMSGGEVFKFAVRTVPASLGRALASAGLAAGDVDWLVMHQANARILDAVAERLGVAPERVVSNLARYGNTSAASVPLALDEAVKAGRIVPGQVLATAGFGAGLTWASAIVRYDGPPAEQ